MPKIALIGFSALCIFIAGCSSRSRGATGENISARVIPLTSSNRNYPGIMFGGWGPHLRALMRNSNGELWFVTDAGPDVQHNEQLLYHRFDGERWKNVATIQEIPGIQQNVASVMCGDVIFSYGLSVRDSLVVEECVFDTRARSLVSRGPLVIAGQRLLLPPSCNYVGAAVGPDGRKIVWWTTVGVSGGEGKWSYIYERSDGWAGPIVSALGGFNDFGYVFASFNSKDVVSVAGQFFAGAYPVGTYAAGCAEFRLGDKLEMQRNFYSLSTNAADCGRSAADIWVSNGGTHVIAETQKGTVAYYFKPAALRWPDCDKPLCVLTNVHRARFFEAGHKFYLVSGSVDGSALLLRSVPGKDMAHPIHWNQVTAIRVPVGNREFARPSAIYVESRSYQTTPAMRPEFAIVGHYPEADSAIWHVQFAP